MSRRSVSTRETITVYLVEYHPLAEEWLRLVLKRNPRLRVLSREKVLTDPPMPAEAAPPPGEALQPNAIPLPGRGRSGEPGPIFVIDIRALPESLSESLRSLRARYPAAKALVLSEERSTDELCGLLGLGIQGFVSYREARQRLGAAIQAVSRGTLFVPAEALSRFVSHSALTTLCKEGTHAAFTAREKVLIGLLERRLSNKEIASRLEISENTVKFHLSNIFAKVGVHDRSVLVEMLASEARRRASRREA